MLSLEFMMFLLIICVLLIVIVKKLYLLIVNFILLFSYYIYPIFDFYKTSKIFIPKSIQNKFNVFESKITPFKVFIRTNQGKIYVLFR